MTERSLDVVVVGSIGIDTNVYGLGSGLDLVAETSFTDNRDYVGQAGGYSSRGFARLDKATAFIGSVGDDALGAWIRETLIADGIDTTALFSDPTGTARSVNLMYGDGRRKSFYDGKSHMTLQPDLALCRSVLARSSLVHFQLPNWGRLLLPIARELGITISCDLQDIVSLPDAYRQDFIAMADILFFSTVNYADPSPLIHHLLGTHAQRVVIAGMGSCGCAAGVVIDGKPQITFYEALTGEANEPIVDTTGAGDALAVGFLSSYVLDGYGLQDAIIRGQIAARYTCAQKASSANLITRELLDERFKRIKG